MSEEKDAIAATSWPSTVASLASNLRDLGLGSGDIVIVHSSLSALGWIVGGCRTTVARGQSVTSRCPKTKQVRR